MPLISKGGSGSCTPVIKMVVFAKADPSIRSRLRDANFPREKCTTNTEISCHSVGISKVSSHAHVHNEHLFFISSEGLTKKLLLLGKIMSSSVKNCAWWQTTRRLHENQVLLLCTAISDYVYSSSSGNPLEKTTKNTLICPINQAINLALLWQHEYHVVWLA